MARMKDAMMNYYIDECITTPKGDEMPRGFYLSVGDDGLAHIVVLSDIPEGERILYEETIPVSRGSFEAVYSDDGRTPVHVQDGELVGFRSKFCRGSRSLTIYGDFTPYMVREGGQSYLDDSCPVKITFEKGARTYTVHYIDEYQLDLFLPDGEVTIRWPDGEEDVYF